MFNTKSVLFKHLFVSWSFRFVYILRSLASSLMAGKFTWTSWSVCLVYTMIWGGYTWNLSWLLSCYSAALSRREAKIAWGLRFEAPIESRYVVGQDENSTVISIVCLILNAFYSNIYLFLGLSVLAPPRGLLLLHFSISHSRLQLTARMIGQTIWWGLVVVLNK